MKVLNNFSKLISHLEDTNVPFGYYILFFFFVISIRNFVETLVYNNPLVFLFHWHYICFYIAFALALIIIFNYAVGSKIKKNVRVVLSGFILIFITPIIDYVFSRGDYYIDDYYIGYLEPEYINNLWQRFFTFFGSQTNIAGEASGITLGIRLEILIILLAVFFYIFVKKRNVLRALLFSFITYITIFVYFSVPFVIKGFLKIFGLTYEYSEQLITNFFLLIIFILGTWAFYLYSRRYFWAIVKDIRLTRLIHFELMFIVGILFSIIYFPDQRSAFGQDYLLYFLLLLMAIACAWLFSVITNNIADYKLDQINSANRPLVSGLIELDRYRLMAAVFFIVACTYAWSVHFVAFLIIFAFMGGYFLYSMPPFRLKTIPILSKFIIAVNSLLLMMMGFIYNSGNIFIPKSIAIFVLLGFTAAINFIDIKDYEGDKLQGIKTLPTILGLRKSQLVIAALTLVTYLASYFVLKSVYIFIIFTLAGLAQFYFISRRDYKEGPVFLTYIVSLLILIIYNWLNL